VAVTHVWPLITTAIASMKNGMPSAVAAFNAEAGHGVQLVAPDDASYFAGASDALVAESFPAVEVYVAQGSLGPFDIHRAHADIDDRVTVVIWAEGGNDEIPELRAGRRAAAADPGVHERRKAGLQVRRERLLLHARRHRRRQGRGEAEGGQAGDRDRRRHRAANLEAGGPELVARRSASCRPRDRRPRGVEILEADVRIHGVGSPAGGRPLDADDLRAMAAAAQELEAAGEFRPPNEDRPRNQQTLLKAGDHRRRAAAAGWLTNQRVSDDGTKLLADITDVPRRSPT
jgi:hypothetical protein